ncbi:MAG TPA: Ig-like domain repeat protein [Solirubrobacteraceae bacterium]|nr:Ig-like domain repeat protein [Solirubrobacteraceae bacterium]
MLALAATPAPALAAGSPASALLARDTPPPVLQGTAVALSQVASTTGLDLNVGLGVRDSAKLGALIAAASNPASPSYGHYLTNAQYMAQYAPTAAQASAATAWLKAHGLDVTSVSPDNLLIGVHATAAQAERVFDVALKNFRAGGRTFLANDRAPRVPADLDISAVSGLSNFVVYKPATTCTPNPGSKCGYDGSDFRSAYDVVGDGTGQTLGFTLWGESLPQSDYNGYATATGTTALNVGGSGDDGLNFIPIGGTTTESDTDGEVALDTEIAHGVAPGVHETYWLGHDSGSIMETVLNDAANSSISVISNSWGAQAGGCPTDTNMESALQHGAATGKTFYFATGDSGASSGCSYPATSQYAVAVGGTVLNSITNETAFANGGGCSNAESRPSWQTGIGSPLVWPSTACTGRATPDVSADSGIGTYLYLDGSPSCCTGGTSLATPIWAAATVIYNKHNAATGRPGVGFDAPLIYQLGNDPTTYPHDFHDITSGTNGFAAVAGWDEATGWGSPNFDKLFNNPADITYTGPTSANHGASITLSATLLDHGASTPLVGSKVSFAAAGGSCDANTDGGGHASCSVTVNDAPGHYSAIAVFAGDAGYDAISTTVPFTVNGITTTTTYTGPTSGDYGVPVTLTATLTDNSNSTGISGETVQIGFGAESCSGLTNGSGVASCSVTPTDSPGGSPYTITASFAGDAPTYLASSDTSRKFTVNKAPTATTLTVAPASPSVFGQPVTFTATVSPNDNGGTIAFKDGAGTIVGCGAQAVSGVSHQATCVTPALSVGSHTVSAVYSGDGNYLGSTSANLTYKVNKAATTTTLTVSPASPSVFGQPVTFTATVAPVAPGAGTPTGTVTFTDGGTTIAGCSARPLSATSPDTATCTTAALSVAGSPHSIVATYGGDGSFLSSGSSALSYTVHKASTTTTVTASPASPSTFGQPVTFTASVAPVAPGAGTPTGTVAFTVDGTAVGSPTLSGTSHASVATSSLSAGSHTIGAAYSGDGSFLPSAGNLSYVVTCTVTITGNHSGALEVTSTTCLAPGAVVGGPIVVHGGASLDLEGASVNGSVSATGGSGVIRVCNSTISGTVDIKSQTGLVIVGDPGDASCAPNSIGGSLILQSNTGGVEAINNRVTGAISTSGNSGPGPFPGDPTTISGNHS